MIALIIIWHSGLVLRFALGRKLAGPPLKQTPRGKFAEDRYGGRVPITCACRPTRKKICGDPRFLVDDTGERYPIGANSHGRLTAQSAADIFSIGAIRIYLRSEQADGWLRKKSAADQTLADCLE